jgi:hypothetical protein
MQKTTSQPGLSRRNFLKLLAAAGITATAASVLNTFAPWLDYDGQVSQIHRPLERGTAIPAQMREIVRYATLAANGHNTQAWKFAILENAIEIHPDHSRRLPAVDPHERELWISLGCALENLCIAARASGYAPEVTYPDSVDFIHTRLTADTPQLDAQLDAIPLRQNTRSEFDGQPVQTAALEQLQALPLEPGVGLRFVSEPAGLEMLLDYVNQGNLSQYADQTYIAELIEWLRFNKPEALAALDGLYSRCSGNPEVPRWAGQMVMAGTRPQQQADADAKKLRSSAGAVIIASGSDSKTAWVRAGQVYERLALKLTSLNIKSAFLNQPIEVTELRGQFQTALGLDDALPQLLVRYGYAGSLPYSLRRPLEQVLNLPA